MPGTNAERNVEERPLPEPAGRRRWRRFTIAESLVALAMIAANLALVSEICKLPVTRNTALTFSALVLGANAVFVLIFGAALRFRLLPLMAMFTTASLTEALLWRSAAQRSDNLWIAVIAVFGLLLVGAFLYGLQTIRRRR